MSTVGAQATAAGLVAIAVARWPSSADDPPPRPLAGFVASSFSPLVAEVAERCLRDQYATAPVPAALGERTAVVIASVSGDRQTTVDVAHAVDTGERVSPLLFFQAVPNAVAGHIAARWSLAGPVVCVSPTGCAADDPALRDGLDVAALLISDGDADDALVVAVEQSTDPRGDHAVAVLVRRDDRADGDPAGGGP
jgi:3-oxoacyl-(acyl-carrier-protein) synthase